VRRHDRLPQLMFKPHPTVPDLWTNGDESRVISLEDGRYHLRDEDGDRAEVGSLERAQHVASRIWD
jgi:hypothetical protein